MFDFSFLLRHLQYSLFARHKKGYGIHPPFLFRFITEIMQNEDSSDIQKELSSFYRQLMKNRQTIQVVDLGAGSKKMSKPDRRICDIAANSATKKKYRELLFRMVKHFKPGTILELGTSLGIGTLNLALANPESEVHTIEGCPNTAEIAAKHFKQFYATNIRQHIGNFDDMLTPVISEMQNLNFVFFDGNHQKDATLRYFHACLPYVNNNTIFVFDDINWSRDMKEAWETITKHEEIRLTIDIFQFGIVFFKKELSKQNFRIRF